MKHYAPDFGGLVVIVGIEVLIMGILWWFLN